jgi:hypothetical protein
MAKQLTADVIALAGRYGHHGYRKIAALLRQAQAGWWVSDARIGQP